MSELRPIADHSVAPLYVGPRNAEHVVGQSWRWVRDTARRLGVRILRVGGKPLIPAGELAQPLEREASQEPGEPAELTPEQEREATRRALGMELVP